jgi:hypothetical protein
MSAQNVFDFLRTVAARADVLDALKVKTKDEVMAAASGFGFPFIEEEFDSLIWSLEVRMAEKRREKFDPQFPLWQTMWGKYYFEYLVTDVIPSVGQADVDAVLMVVSQPGSGH